jgi:hypothetical protein
MSSQQILIKRSSVPFKVPTTSDLALGEIALNVADGLAYMRKIGSPDTVVAIGKPLNYANITAGLGYVPLNTSNPYVTGTLTSQSILPAADLTYDLGSPTARWNNMYVNTAHLGVNTLYLGDTAVLGTSMNTIVVKADVDQSMLIQTSGVGSTTLTSATSVSIASTGVNGDVYLHADGTGAGVRLSAAANITLTPGSAYNVVVDGGMKVNSLSIENTNGSNISFSSSDPLIDLNKNVSGNGVQGSGLAGFEVWRGDTGLSHFQFVFDESVQRFRVGMVGSLQTLATQPYVDSAIGALITGVSSFNTRGGAITLNSTDVTTALGFTPYNSSNPGNYISASGAPVQSVFGRAGTVAMLSSDVVTALGFTPYSAANPTGFVTATTAPVTSVFGKTGAVAMSSFDVQTALTYSPLNKAGDTFSGNLTSNGTATVTGLPNPSAGTDAANKNYVDAAVTGLTWKNATAVATTGNITLSGLQVIDGYSVLANDRVLVKNQTAATDNGIYVASSSAWSRASDTNTGALILGATVFAEHGSTQAATGWTVTNASAPTIGTTPITFAQFNGASALTAGVGLAISGNTISVQLGAGIAQLPTSEVGIDLYTGGGLLLTTDGTNASTSDTAQLSLSKLGTAGTYTSVTTDEYGRITAGSNPTVTVATTVTTNANMTGPITSVGNTTSVASQTGTGSKFVMDTSPTLVTPNLGTPASGNLVNCTFPTLNQSTTGNAATATNVAYSGLTGTVPTWNQNTTGSAATLTTPRTINGISFDGSANITVAAAGSTLTGTSLASNVVSSSLTSVGTLTSLGVTGTVTAGSLSGPLTGNVTGNVSGTAATVTTAAQPAITSVGTLTSLTVSGTSTVGTVTNGISTTASSTLTTASVSQVALVSLPVATYRSAEFIIQGYDATGGKNHTVSLLAVNNGSTSANSVEYGSVDVGGQTATFTVSIVSGNMQLLVTPASANSTVFKVTTFATAA